MAEYLPKYLDGTERTHVLSGTVSAGNLLVVSGTGTVAASSGGSIAWVGVAGQDGVSGDSITVYSGGVQKIVAGTGGVTAGSTVEPAASGGVVNHTPGTNDLYVVGVALTTATAGNTAEILMER